MQFCHFKFSISFVAIALNIVGLSLNINPIEFNLPLLPEGFQLANEQYKISEQFSVFVPILVSSFLWLIYTCMVEETSKTNAQKVFSFYSTLIFLSLIIYSVIMWIIYKCDIKNADNIVTKCQVISGDYIFLTYTTFISIIVFILVIDLFIAISQAHQTMVARNGPTEPI